MINTIGRVKADLKVENILIPVSLQVVQGDFPIPSDGILGLDFIKKYNCVLDYQYSQDWLILRPYNFPEKVAIPMNTGTCPNSFSIPARSEVIRPIYINTKEDELLIPNQELETGIYIASTIINVKKPLVRIINTTNNNITLNNPNIITENLSDYNIFASKNLEEVHKEKVLDKLSKNFPQFVKSELTDLCSEFNDVFALETEQISYNNFYTQKLRLKDNSPVYIKNYRIPYSQKEEISKQVDNLIKDDIVEPSTSEYNSPILLVPKKALPGKTEKRWRLVVDYRQVNKKLIADKFPLPRIDDILDQLGRAKYFSCLDLMSGFHQIELDENSRNITSFSTDKGSFRFKRLPYGIKIAPNSFQRMMSIAFCGLSPAQAFLYMDDLVVLGCSEKHMLKNLRDVFSICRKYNLKLHPDKCSFFSHEVTYLGHKCTDKGILPDDSKFNVVLNYPTPQNADQTKRFVAFCNYYRRFIPNFAEHSRHLSRLCRKHVPFVWTNECKTAFQYLKNCLLSPNILQYPNFQKQFCITTDASKYACGAVLSQEYKGKQLPVAYASRAFTKGESNKSTIEQELAAIHWAITHFKPYIYGKKFLVKSDHRPLSYLFSMKNPSSKLIRMRLDLEEYDFVVEYIRGKENYAADALSRIDFSEIKQIPSHSKNVLKVTTRLQTKKGKLNQNVPKTNLKNPQSENLKIYEALNLKEINKCARLCLKDHNFNIKKGKQIISTIKRNDFIINGEIDLDQLFPKLEKIAGNKGIKRFQLSLGDELFKKIRINEFKEKGNALLKNINIALTPRLTIIKDEDEKLNILRKYHDDPVFGGHPGITRLTNKIRKYFYWKNMTRDIKRYVKSCDQCKKNKALSKTKEPLVLTTTPVSAFDIVLIDTIGPLPKTENGNEYAITIACDLTKYLVTIPVQNKSAKTIAKGIFNGFILTYGPMKKILTDMGTEYKNQVFQELCNLLKIEKINSTAYHHQTLGTVERVHRTFNEYVRSYISLDRNDWDEWLQFFTYCYNTTPSTVHGYCPFELIFGKIPNTFDFLQKQVVDPLYNVDAYEREVKYRLQTAQNRARRMLHQSKITQKRQYDKKLNKIDVAIGDLVLIKNEVGHKLDKLYMGPFKVIGVDSKNNCTVLDNKNKVSKIHKNRLKKYN